MSKRNRGKIRDEDDGNTEGAMVERIAVTVTPKERPNAGEVPCRISGRGSEVHKNVIFLDYDTDYDITFTLDSDHGVTGWATDGFENQEGSCPAAGKGVTAPCSGGKGTTGNSSITVRFAALPEQPGQRVEKYRLNFNNGISCDPIIIIGSP